MAESPAPPFCMSSPRDGSGAEDDDDEVSVHSAISNASDFEEDEEVEYLAMDLVNYLPPDKANKLMKNMRTKEKAVQDLLHRNRSLLDSCQRLDDENQSLTNKLQEVEDTAASRAQAPPAAAPQAEEQPNLDLSCFQQMERSKEERITSLLKERDMLAMRARALDDSNRRLQEALAQVQKDLKKAVAQPQVPTARPAQVQKDLTNGTASGRSALEDEERTYQDLQAAHGSEAVLLKFQQRQDENKQRVSAALQAILEEDLKRIERWGSDISALMLAVDGLETQMKPNAKEKSTSKKGKVVSASSAKDNELAAGNELLQKVSAELLDELSDLRGQLEDTEKQQLALEQTVRGVHDGADAAVAAMGLDTCITAAETEAVAIQQNVERIQGLNVEAVAESLGQTEELVRNLLLNAPPGLFPRSLEAGLSEARREVAEQAVAVAELQSGTLRGVQALQGAHQVHRGEMMRKITEELQRSSQAVEQPLERLRSSLRQQGEVTSRARQRVSDVSDELSIATRRSVTASEAGGGAAEVHGGGDALSGGLREVKSMARSLVTGLEESGRALEGRMDKVLSALLGEVSGTSPSKQQPKGGGGACSPTAAVTAPAAAAAATAIAVAAGDEESSAAAAAGGAEGKKKKSKRKGRLGEPADGNTEDQLQGQSALSDDPEARLRAEFAAAFAGKEKKGGAARGGEKRERVVSGAALLQELTSLKSDADALQARMAERRRGQTEASQPSAPQASAPQAASAAVASEERAPAAAPAPAPAPKARRKKMFV